MDQNSLDHHRPTGRPRPHRPTGRPGPKPTGKPHPGPRPTGRPHPRPKPHHHGGRHPHGHHGHHGPPHPDHPMGHHPIDHPDHQMGQPDYKPGHHLNHHPSMEPHSGHPSMMDRPLMHGPRKGKPAHRMESPHNNRFGQGRRPGNMRFDEPLSDKDRKEMHEILKARDPLNKIRSHSHSSSESGSRSESKSAEFSAHSKGSHEIESNGKMLGMHERHHMGIGLPIIAATGGFLLLVILLVIGVMMMRRRGRCARNTSTGVKGNFPYKQQINTVDDLDQVKA